jgi:hypothetical protein
MVGCVVSAVVRYTVKPVPSSNGVGSVWTELLYGDGGRPVKYAEQGWALATKG